MIPEAGEDLVGLPAEQERVGALVDLVEICRGLIVVLEERQGPSAALEAAPAVLIRPAESLHDSIDGDVRDGRHFHGRSSLSRWALSSTIDGTAAPTSSVAPGPVRPIHPAPGPNTAEEPRRPLSGGADSPAELGRTGGPGPTK